MSFLIGLLTVVLVLDCLLLILLVLIQLPKKEAGAGIAFGGAATDALFGAGTGNVLTKTTKYATVAFFVLLLVLGSLQSQFYHKGQLEFQRKVDEQNKAAALPSTLPQMSPTAAAVPTPSNALATPPLTLPNPPAEAPTAPTPAPEPKK